MNRVFAVARRASQGIALLVVACLLAGGWATLAFADPDAIDTPEARATLRKALVESEDPAVWDSVLRKLIAQARDSHPDLYGSIVGPIFTDEALTQAMEPMVRRNLFTRLVAHLVQNQPKDDTVLLVAAFLPHLASDSELLALVRKKMPLDVLTQRADDWDRLQRSVMAKLTDGEAAVRRAAIRIAAQREGAGVATGVAVLAEALKAGGKRPPAKDLEAYYDAFERLLGGHRFTSLSALSDFLDPFRERLEKYATWTPLDRERMRGDLWEAVNTLSAVKGGRDKERSREAARFYGRLLLDKAAAPQDLVSFFRAEGDQDPELQRGAVLKAKELKPTANGAWAGFLMRCLEHSSDAKVLDHVIEIMGPTFLKPSEPAQQLATAVARRLKARMGMDSVRQRTQLAGILGVIGTVQDVHLALPDAKDLAAGNGHQAPVSAVLIRAVGLVSNGFVAGLVPYLRTSDGGPQPEWARQAVAESLGLPGFQSNETQGRLAALMLKHILTGEAVAQGNGEDPNAFALAVATPEPDAAVRAAAIDSMQHFPGPETAPVLLGIAQQETAEAERAVNMLGRQLRRGSADAGKAIAQLIGDHPGEARLQTLLETVAKETPPDLSADAWGALAEKTRGILTAEETPDALRMKAVDGLARLADEEAIQPITQRWQSQQDDAAKARWKQAVVRLFVSLGKAGATRGGLDEKVAARIGEIVEADRHADALEILEAMGESSARFWLKYARADAHYSYASVSNGRSLDARRGDLDAAIRLYTELHDEAPAGNKHDVLRSLYRILQDRARPPYVGEGKLQSSKRFLWLALGAAVKLGDVQVARDALERIVRELEQDNSLTDQEKAELERFHSDLQAIIDGAK